MKLLDGDRWRDRLARLAALAPAIARDGKPWRPKLTWRFPRPDRDKLTLKKGPQIWQRVIVAA